jgi:hypothetical protein
LIATTSYRQQAARKALALPRASAFLSLGIAFLLSSVSAFADAKQDKLNEILEFGVITLRDQELAAFFGAQGLKYVPVADRRSIIAPGVSLLKKDDIFALAKTLEDPKVPVIEQFQAVDKLLLLQEEAAPVAFIVRRILKDKQAPLNIRKKCAQILVDSAPDEEDTFKVFLTLFKDTETKAELRFWVGYHLASLKEKRAQATSALLRVLQDDLEDPLPRCAAAWSAAVASDFSRKSLRACAQILANHQEEEALRFYCCWAILAAKEKGKDYITVLGQSLETQRVSVRLTSALALNKLGYSSVLSLDALCDAIKKQHSFSDVCAIELARSGLYVQHAIPCLISILNDTQATFQSRRQAAWALGYTSRFSAEATEALKNILFTKSEAYTLQLSAAEAVFNLAWQGNEQAQDIIKKIIKTSEMDWDTREGIINSIPYLQERASIAVPELLAVAVDTNEFWNIRKCCLDALANLGPFAIKAAPGLRAYVEREEVDDEQLRRMALEALAKIEATPTDASVK